MQWHPTLRPLHPRQPCSAWAWLNAPYAALLLQRFQGVERGACQEPLEGARLLRAAFQCYAAKLTTVCSCMLQSMG